MKHKKIISLISILGLFSMGLFLSTAKVQAGCCLNSCTNVSDSSSCPNSYTALPCNDPSVSCSTNIITGNTSTPDTSGAFGTSSTTGDTVMPNQFTIPTGFGLPDPVGGITAIISNLLSWLLGIIGMIAVIAFVISGAQYLIASGNEKMIEVAKRNMFYSIIGIVVALSGVVIIQAISSILNAYILF